MGRDTADYCVDYVISGKSYPTTGLHETAEKALQCTGCFSPLQKHGEPVEKDGKVFQEYRCQYYAWYDFTHQRLKLRVK